MADVNRIANLEAGDIDVDLARDAGRIAHQFQFVAHDVEHAALLEARRCFFIDERDRHGDFNRGVLGQAQEVGMQGAIRNRMKGNVLGQGAKRLSANLDHHDRVHEVAGAQLAHQFLCFDMDRQGFFIAAVNNGGDPTFASQCTGGSLASPFARFGGQSKSVAHVRAFRNRLKPVLPVTPPGMTMTGRAGH